MKTNRKKLLEVLQAVKPGLANKEIIEQTTSFIFTGTNVLTYNDEISVSHPIDLDIVGAVQAKELIALLNKSSDEEIELETTESELRVISKKSKAGIKLQAQTNVADIEAALGTPVEWEPLPGKFKEALAYAAFSVGKNMTKPLLTCIFVTGTEAFSSDDFRITYCNIFDAEISDGLLIPGTVASDIKNYDVEEYSITDGWVHLRTAAGVVFSFRTLKGEFPAEKIKQIINSVDGDKIKLPSDLDGALERAGIFSSGVEVRTANDDRIQAIVRAGVLTIRGEGSSGWFEESSRIRYKGDDLEFEVNPGFFQEILKHTDEMVVGHGMLKFESKEFVHIVRTFAPRS